MRCLLLLAACLLCCSFLYSQSCTDSAYKLRFSAPDSIYTTHHITTADQGTLVVGEVFAWPLKKGLLFRLDQEGVLLWSRILTDASGLLMPSRVLELSDGSIVIAGISRQGPAAPEKIYLARLDASGSLLWQRLYAPSHNNRNPLYINALTEGIGGDLLLGWTRAGINLGAGEDANSVVVLRVNNTGEVVWSQALRVSELGLVTLSGLFVRQGKIIMPGYAYDNRMACYVNGAGAFFIGQLDYGTGTVQAHRAYCFQHGGTYFGTGNTDVSHHATILHDGSLALFGAFGRNNDSIHFYKVLFDNQGNPYSAQVYGAPFQVYNMRIQVLPSGRAGIVVIDDRAGVGYRATIDALGAIVRQRRFPYNSPSVPLSFYYHDSYAFMTYRWAEDRDRSFTIASNHTRGTEAGIEFSRLEGDTDTLACLGTDYPFISSLPFVLRSIDWSLPSMTGNTTFSASFILTSAVYPLHMETVCKEISTCRSLQVSGPATLCAGEGEAVYTGSRNGGCTQREVWQLLPASTEATLVPGSDSTVRIRFTGTVRGSVTVSLVASLASCPAISDTVQLTVLPALQPLPADTTLCAGSTLDLSPGEGFASYLWQDGSTAPIYTVLQSGTYWVRVPSAEGCRQSDTVTVSVVPLPANFISDTSKCADLPLALHPTRSFAAYLWSDGSTGPSLQVDKAGRYGLQVTDTNGCTGEEEVVVEEKPCPRQVYFPTAFTPNGDGKNDRYRPTVLAPLVQYRFEIYNRWGQKVFSTGDVSEGWDGRLGSALQPSGLFTWICRYQFPNAAPVQAKGSFLLLK